VNPTCFHHETIRNVENKNKIPVNIRFFAKTSDIRNFSVNIRSDVKTSEVPTLLLYCHITCFLPEDTADTTRVKLAVTSPSRHFCDLAKKTRKQKRTDKLKNNSRKTYYSKIISQTTQTNCFKRLVS